MEPLPGLVSVAPPLGGGVAVPHIPLVDPFALAHEIDDGVVSELRAYFSDVVPFPVRLPALSQFPNGPAYLNPEPSAPSASSPSGSAGCSPSSPAPAGRSTSSRT